jgi:hypothetical protein
VRSDWPDGPREVPGHELTTRKHITDHRSRWLIELHRLLRDEGPIIVPSWAKRVSVANPGQPNVLVGCDAR